MRLTLLTLDRAGLTYRWFRVFRLTEAPLDALKLAVAATA